ncbi:uncharacterized protein EV154DRAFT_504028 [Mucor mucedo]|uniref:uncharacterized protein n=1 Tax=Mucor mucedo TaxID=29922 RepID=UPI00221EE94D|nr:uncharacterized protein EV154DRAFT_504028 [Mucor mucedo]KAI7892771.1 hypothetical protein EV154DRAFT_504028 [Mucor mucedo]
MYNKMIELSEQQVIGEVSTSCPACPEVSSVNANDKQFVIMDGNFRLKNTKSLAQDNELSKISGLSGYKTMWMDQFLIKRFDKSEQSSKATKSIANNTTATTTKNITAKETPAVKGLPVKATVGEPRTFQALVHQNRTSAIYPVRGIFGSGCARHDTVTLK